MDFKDISDELKEKVASASSPEDILELAKTEGYELTDEQLEEVAGGGIWDRTHDAHSDGCPKCGSHDLNYSSVGQIMWYTCKKCGHKWC